MRCPHCANRLLQRTGSATRLRIKGLVEFDDAGHATAQCYWCGQRVQVPIQLTVPQPAEGERFVLGGRLTR